MDNPNITMEEYIQLMADKARGRDQTFNWETATYGEVYCEDLDSFIDFETDFPSIVYNDASTSNQNVSSEPTDLSSYKLIPIIDLKLELVNDYAEINIESCSENIDVKPMDSVICTSNDTTPVEFDENIEINHDTPVYPEDLLNEAATLTFNWETATYGEVYCEDLDSFIDFETDFPAIVYNDASTSNQNVSSEPTDLSFYKLIPIIDLKLELVNDYAEINIESCSENIDVKPMDSVICTSNDTTPVEFDENIEINHDTPGINTVYPKDLLNEAATLVEYL
ncbi:hypothetical protein Tco_0007549 [Tanacetum coccineum]